MEVEARRVKADREKVTSSIILEEKLHNEKV